MMHKAWCSIVEVPYCFPRSSIKFQGHTGWKIDDLDQIWARLLGRSQLSNPSDLPCLFSFRYYTPECYYLTLTQWWYFSFLDNGSYYDSLQLHPPISPFCLPVIYSDHRVEAHLYHASWNWLGLQWKLHTTLISGAHLIDIRFEHESKILACNKRPTAACQPSDAKASLSSSTVN